MISTLANFSKLIAMKNRVEDTLLTSFSQETNGGQARGRGAIGNETSGKQASGKETNGGQTKLSEAICYSLAGGGKRIRPMIVHLIAEVLGHGLDVSDAALAAEFFPFGFFDCRRSSLHGQ